MSETQVSIKAINRFSAGEGGRKILHPSPACFDCEPESGRGIENWHFGWQINRKSSHQKQNETPDTSQYE